MSDFFGQAGKKAEEAVKEGETAVQHCLDKTVEAGKNAFDKGCEAAKKTCDHVSEDIGSKLPAGFKK